MDLAIIGAGPAGIMASLQAAKSNHNIILIESNEKIGRKLLTTGSGRCNITNRNINPINYYCENTEFVQKVLSLYSPEKFCDDLAVLGIPVYSTADGWTYPISNSAANVVDILETHLNLAGVQVLSGKKVVFVKFLKNKFEIGFFDGKKMLADRIMFASGGMAYPVLGSDGELFQVIKLLGHRINPVFPALAPLITEMKITHKLQGVRQDVKLTLVENGKIIASNSGNIIFTNWGINGPGVMDISHLITKNPKSNYYLEINFLAPHEEKIEKFVDDNVSKPIPLSIALESLLSKKIIQTVLKTLNISEQVNLNDLTEKKIISVLNSFMKFRIDVKGVRGFEFSQASIGGVDVNDIDPLTMQSKINKRIYFAGEVIDIVGPCGGYNLHWAFASGYIGGQSLKI